MRKVVKALPRFGTAVMMFALCLAVGMFINGFRSGAIPSVLGWVIIMALLTLRNYSPMAVEAYFNPDYHEMRTRCDAALDHLVAVDNARRTGDPVALDSAIGEAHQFLAKLRPPA